MPFVAIAKLKKTPVIGLLTTRLSEEYGMTYVGYTSLDPEGGDRYAEEGQWGTVLLSRGFGVNGQRGSYWQLAISTYIICTEACSDGFMKKTQR